MRVTSNFYQKRLQIIRPFRPTRLASIRCWIRQAGLVAEFFQKLHFLEGNAF